MVQWQEITVNGTRLIHLPRKRTETSFSKERLNKELTQPAKPARNPSTHTTHAAKLQNAASNSIVRNAPDTSTSEAADEESIGGVTPSGVAVIVEPVVVVPVVVVLVVVVVVVVSFPGVGPKQLPAPYGQSTVHPISTQASSLGPDSNPWPQPNRRKVDSPFFKKKRKEKKRNHLSVKRMGRRDIREIL